MAHHHVAGAQCLDHELVDERLRAHGTHAVVEAQRHQPVHSGGLERDEFLAPARQTCGRAVGIDELFRAWLEHEDRRRELQLRGALLHGANHLLMPEVHAVEIAHGEHAAAGSFGEVVQTAY
jgi:hypothetical protein